MRIQFVFTVAILFAFEASGQMGVIKRGDRYLEKEAYPAAARLYEQSIAAGSSSPDVVERLGTCYYKVGNLERAVEVWKPVIANTQSAEVAYMNGHALMGMGNYAEASKSFDRFGELSKKWDESRALAEACERADAIRGDGKGWRVTIADVSTRASEMGPVIAGNKLVFAAARPRGFFARVLNLRNENYFYDLYAAEVKGPVNFEKAKLLRAALRSRYHDGPATFSRDLNTVYFTRSNQSGAKLKRDAERRAHLQLFSAQLQGKKYKSEVSLPFNSEGSSNGHAALSPDGQRMVFASSVAGGKGGSDLYVSALQNGKWSTPISLGSLINTSGDELFPFIAHDGTLFFASNGHPGLGGLDILYAEPKGEGWAKVTNVGGPVNSPRDDFGMVWDKRGQGYFSSNRPGGKGSDDIYHFVRIKPIEGVVVNAVTEAPIPDAAVRLLSSGGSETVLKTDSEGRFIHYAEASQDYVIDVSKAGHIPAREVARAEASVVAPRRVQIKLTKYPVATVKGTANDASTRLALQAAKVQLIGEARNISFNPDANGGFGGEVDTASTYTAIGTLAGFKPALLEFNTYGMVSDVEFPVNLDLRPGAAQLLAGKSVEKFTGAIVPGAKLRVVNEEGRVMANTLSRRDGRFFMAVDTGANLSLIGSKEGYFAARMELPAFALLNGEVNGEQTVMFEMVPAKVGELVKVIHYDYRMSDINRTGRKDLDEIVFFLQDNPAAVVELSSHTDSRGSFEYNQTLSDARSKAAVDYVVSKGIARDRISAKGYGETVLLNECTEGVECAEELHAQNRRTEIRVTAIR